VSTEHSFQAREGSILIVTDVDSSINPPGIVIDYGGHQFRVKECIGVGHTPPLPCINDMLVAKKHSPSGNTSVYRYSDKQEYFLCGIVPKG